MTYGVLLGLAAATAVIIGNSFDPAHAGWVAAAAMFVMRPVQEMGDLQLHLTQYGSCSLNLRSQIRFHRSPFLCLSTRGSAF